MARIPGNGTLGSDWIVARLQDGGGGDNGHGGGSKIGEWSSLIGIVTAIVGNILIALALNVQRYSHLQLDRGRTEARQRAKEALERSRSQARENGYGTSERNSMSNDDEDDVDPSETQPLMQSFRTRTAEGDSNYKSASKEKKVASSYLKSPSWWLGQVLMTVGEMGNFLAYGFAPASIVSPLGVVALISNCAIAPMFFGEKFRKQDFWGVVIAVAGAVTVVLSAKQEETKLDPDSVWDAITKPEFEIYLGVSTICIVILMWASPRYGNRTILIDLGLVGLFGGYTALTTKGVSSMLSSTLLRAFTTPVTYILILILLATAVMQVRYVNKALQRFDSTQVIPIQFVLFTLSVIIGSAILYRDFERSTTRQAFKFVGGCLLTFFGVFLVTTGRSRGDDDEEGGLSDNEDVEETIGLRYQDIPDRPIPNQPENRATSRPGLQPPSRHSSRGSRVSFADAGAGLQPMTFKRRAQASRSVSQLSTAGGEPASLINNPWREGSLEGWSHSPSQEQQAPDQSDDSFFTTADSLASIDADPDAPPQPVIHPPTPSDCPSTPRSPPRNAHYNHLANTPFISPSPLSSTVSAVVADALLRSDGDHHHRGPIPARRRSMRRGSRPTLRSSLYMPSDGGGGELHGYSEPVLPTVETAGDRLSRVHNGDVGVESESERKGLLRGRARSLSYTLGEFFGRRRGRRNTNPEAGVVEQRSGNGATVEE